MNLVFFYCMLVFIRRFLNMFICTSRKVLKLHYKLHRKCVCINNLAHEIISQDLYVMRMQVRNQPTRSSPNTAITSVSLKIVLQAALDTLRVQTSCWNKRYANGEKWMRRLR